MIEELLLPLQLPFMRDAFLITLMVAVPSAMLSCFLVLKGWSLMGDAVSHAVLPGIVLAYILGAPLALGAFITGVVCALTTGWLAERSRVKRDTVMGVVFSAMFALGLVMYTKIRTDVHLDHILFGDMLGVATRDLIEAGAIGLFVVAAILIRRRDMVLHAFDPAQALGLNARVLHYGLLIMLTLCVIAAMKAVGIILAIALLIAPGATAFLVTHRFAAMLAVSVGVAVTSVVTGVYTSFFIDSAPAPTVVLVMTGFFIAAFALSVMRAQRMGAV
ncbi:MAG: hypothetical protein GKR99_07495 [Rhodobacteraceae bacterium]|nr:hypothetical protein [Paracoccaceae bacterium]